MVKNAAGNSFGDRAHFLNPRLQETCEELKRIAERADDILIQTLRDIAEEDQMLLGCRSLEKSCDLRITLVFLKECAKLHSILGYLRIS